ncbi:MAG: bifunctional 4-hydroxy-2-oxoglutarate aldolase/2-dehydro-3-deoxy-phosphogluconate aldolase [Spirochaeta sp.]|nr:bifunctional 4-hydroxy-2-oxoglutarate aldolase/2-dehydro-3-deoxy-phosphogluconate aldolase [Spirochaeta sp.]
MNEILKKIGELGLVPVVKIERAEHALPLGRALLEANLPIAEITFRTEAAEAAITVLNRELPELLVGAGTVLTVDQVKKATGAGAAFIVAPGFNPVVVDYCVEKSIPITPGINNPTQIEMALARNLQVLKFFPAEASGGLAMLKAMAAPYGGIKFIPTGGINAGNLNSYLSFDRILACGGSWMVKPALISAGNFAEITRLTREALSLMHGFELAHLGFNENNRDRALQSGELLQRLFNFPLIEKDERISAGECFEIRDSSSLGERGHIALAVNSMDRALSFLQRAGVSVQDNTAVKKDGLLKEIYIKPQVSGFAIKLIQKDN